MVSTSLDPVVRFLPTTHSFSVKTAPLVNGLTYVMGVCAGQGPVTTFRLAL